MIDYNVEELVRQYVNFRHGVASQGWNVVFCEVCGDGSRTKGPRGGWLFSDGGNTAFYHCFNCGCNESFSTNREHAFSKGMRNVFDSFGIPSTEYNGLLLKNKTVAAKGTVNKPKVSHVFIDMPDHFSLLKDCDSEQAKAAKKFLRDKYALSTKHFSFYFATGITASKEMKDKAYAKSLSGRLVIPYFKSGKLIYYQARDVTGTHKLKYISPDIPKKNILFNIDQLYRSTDEPLYVVESALDAIHLNGIATMGNELSSAQRELLASSKRKKILVPDFNGDSSKLCEQFIQNGWSVSFPEYRTKAKDVSEAVVKYGKLYVAYDIVKNIKTADEANMIMKYMNLS